MVPRAKKNLHECKYHLAKMKLSQNVEELAINFAAFVNSGRNVTFVLQKEYASDLRFIKWYGQPGDTEPQHGVKMRQMKDDGLCRFFHDLRNEIIKEGINGFVCSTHIKQFNSSTDLIDQPAGSSLEISSDGMYYRVGRGTPQEDRIPAKTRAEMLTTVGLTVMPSDHLGNKLIPTEHTIFSICDMYYDYLLSLVEEWSGILNSPTASS